MYPHDYAVIRLDRPLGDLAGYRPVAIGPNLVGDYARMLAYHADRCEWTDNQCAKGTAFPQYAAADSVRKLDKAGWFVHGIDTFKGSSGAGIANGSAASSPIVAINIAQSTAAGSNIGLAISERIYADIAAWASL